jgi:hypothetical protein
MGIADALLEGGRRFYRSIGRPGGTVGRLARGYHSALSGFASPQEEQPEPIAPYEAVPAPTPPSKPPVPFFPAPGVFTLRRDEPFMPYSTCSARDFFHPKFAEMWNTIKLDHPYFLHRKYWEWVYVANALTDLCGRGRRGVGFAVGTEPLPAYFASLGSEILATDAPPEIGVAAGWQAGNQFAMGISNIPIKGMISPEDMAARCTFRHVDMNHIPDDVTGFDFCWSSCSLEHLGTMQLGIDFVINSVEKTLKIGGVACHTTEFNLSSNADTVGEGATVLYRRQDIERLIDTLRERGHLVDDLRVAPDSFAIDGYVDVPPYGPPAHLKLALMGYVSTSVAIIVKRGR